MESLPALSLYFPICKMEVIKQLIAGDCVSGKTGLSFSPLGAGDGVLIIYFEKKNFLRLALEIEWFLFVWNGISEFLPLHFP